MNLLQADALIALKKSNSKVTLLFTTKDGSGSAKRPDIVLAHPNHYIDDSLYFDLDGLFSTSTTTACGVHLHGMMVTPEVFAESLGKLGISNEDHIVIYDDYGNFYASRVWFMFKAMGHNLVQVLDGGLHQWLLAGLPLCRHLTRVTSQSQYIATPSSLYKFIDKDFMLSCIEDVNTVVIDARSLARFNGVLLESRSKLRSGHIPNSVNMHYNFLLDAHSKFIDITELEKYFAPYEGKQLVFTCGSGVTACILAQGADLLGLSPLYVYDGSWSEWGADPTVPISIAP